jgi:transposase
MLVLRTRPTVGPGCPEAPTACRSRRGKHAPQTLRPWGTPLGRPVCMGMEEEDHGCGLCTVLRAGCAQADRGRLCADAWRSRDERRTTQAHPHLRHDDRRAAPTRGLAGGAGGDARGAREHRQLLQPVWNLLEDAFSLQLVNARHIKQVPGRKTDVRDAEWIATLLRHGLLRASFVPERPQRELRELVRYRTSLVREQSAEINRLQKTLEGANINLAAVATDILGKSAREMLQALIGGITNASALADLAKGKLRAKLPELERALIGRVGPHQPFLLARQLAHIDYLEALIEEVSAEITERMCPFEAALEHLDTIPGVGRRIAEVIVAEIGLDLERFPGLAHLASWAGMCPGNNESAGKRQTGRTRKGSKWLRSALVEAAHAAGRKKGSYLAARYQRLVVRRRKNEPLSPWATRS